MVRPIGVLEARTALERYQRRHGASESDALCMFEGMPERFQSALRAVVHPLDESNIDLVIVHE